MSEAGNVAANVEVTAAETQTATTLFALAAQALGGIPTNPADRRNFAYKAAELAAEFAGDLARPVEQLAKYLAENRAATSKSPVKGILRSVEQIEVARSAADKPLYKAEIKIEATSGGKFSKAGDVETFRSQFTHNLGYRNFINKAQDLVGKEVLVYKYLESTDGRGVGDTANVVVNIVGIGVNQPTAAQPDRQPAANNAAASTPQAEEAPAPVEETPAEPTPIAKARAARPTTKKAIVEHMRDHFGLAPNEGAAECKRIAAALKIDVNAPTEDDIAKIWNRFCNEQAAAA